MPSRDETRRIRPAGTLNTCLVAPCCVPGWAAEAGPPGMLLAHLSVQSPTVGGNPSPYWSRLAPNPSVPELGFVEDPGVHCWWWELCGGQQEGYSWSRQRGLQQPEVQPSGVHGQSRFGIICVCTGICPLTVHSKLNEGRACHLQEGLGQVSICT